jgi:hypothetical protein
MYKYAVCVYLSPALPLTVENVVKEVEGVRNPSELWQWLSSYVPITRYRIEDVVEQFFQGHGRYQPSWRALIFALDGAEETRLANRIRHYAESIQGRYML